MLTRNLLDGLMSGMTSSRKIKLIKKHFTGFEFGSHNMVILDVLNKHYIAVHISIDSESDNNITKSCILQCTYKTEYER